MNSFSKTVFADRAIIALVLIAYLVFQFPFLKFDLWNDEIYTLKHFTFVPVIQILTDYHVPNNHILFNLINHFYLDLIGEQDVYSLMEHPWLLRVFTLVYALGTIFFTYKCANRFIGKTEAILSIILLCTSVPFYNFGVEIRGYCFTSFLLAALAYHVFSYLETSSRKHLFLIFIIGSAAIYAIPLSLYAITGILIYLFSMAFISLLTKLSKTEGVNRMKDFKKYMIVMIAVIAGVFFALACYAPIFQEVFFNEYVVPDPSFTNERWMKETAKVFTAFFSHRYWLLPLILFGAIGNFYQWIVRKKNNGFGFLIFLSVLITFPFIFSLIRNDAAPDRTYINLIPFFSMLMAWMIGGVFCFSVNRKLNLFLKTGIGVYCFVILSYQLKATSTYLLNDILSSKRSHDIYYNYYQWHFRPLSVVKNFKESAFTDSSFVVIRDSEPHDLPEYLNKFSIPFHDLSLIDSVLMTGKKVFLFSRYPNEINNEFFQKQHSCTIQQVSKGISYHNLFALEYKKIP